MATADQITAKELRRLERKVSALYRQAAADLRGKVREYTADFAARDTVMQGRLAAGEISQTYYDTWKANNIGRGERWTALKDEIARRASDTNAIAAAYVNDTTPGIYSLNAQRTAYTIQAARPDIDFIGIHETAIANLARGNNQYEFLVRDGYNADGSRRYTYHRLQPDYVGDYNWNARQIERQLSIGLLAGDGPKEFAQRFLNIMGVNERAARRNARTAVTSAHNAGTMDTLRAARDAGINVKKQWMSTHDDRTRGNNPRDMGNHVIMDGETADIDAPFSNGCMYPGDPAGAPYEVYNCRCTMVYVLPDVSAEPLQEVETPPAQEQEAAEDGAKLPAATFESTKGITDEFKKGMQSTLAACEYPEIRDIYSKYQDQLVCINDNHARGAHFDKIDGGIRMNAQKVAAGSSYDKPYETAFHEFGHMIDWLMNGKDNSDYISNVSGIEGLLRSDFNAFKKGLGVKSAQDAVDALKAEQLSDYARANISDTLEMFTKGGYPLGFGHGKSYHSKRGKNAREFFAEVLDSAATNPESFEQMRRLFPNAVEKVFQIIREDVENDSGKSN